MSGRKPVLAPGSIVHVGAQKMTVLRFIPRDERYLLETRDGFNTRRYYRADEVSPATDEIKNGLSVGAQYLRATEARRGEEIASVMDDAHAYIIELETDPASD